MRVLSRLPAAMLAAALCALPAVGERLLPADVGASEYITSAPLNDAIRRGKDCTGFRIRPGDRAPYDVALDRPFERAELISLRKVPFGVPVTVEFWRFVVPGPVASVATIVGQFHSSAQPGQIPMSPPVALEIGRGVERLVTRSTTEGLPKERPGNVVRWTGPLEAGRWVRWRLRIVFDPGKGRIQLWRDGKQLVDQTAPVGYNDPVGPYWQYGIYRPSAQEPIRVLYAGMRQRIGRELPHDRGQPPAVTTCVPAP